MAVEFRKICTHRSKMHDFSDQKLCKTIKNHHIKCKFIRELDALQRLTKLGCGCRMNCLIYVCFVEIRRATIDQSV